MKSAAKVVVVGGGVVGASVLFHLTRAGWSDVLLIERDELTSGSTWHAAGGMHTVNGDPNVAKLQQYKPSTCTRSSRRYRACPVVCTLPARHAGRDAGADGLVENGTGPWPVSRHGPGAHFSQ